MTITEFLEARIAEDEAVARAAVDSERPGQHWQWVTGQTDTPVAPGDLAEAQGHQPTISLRTVEEFPSSAGMLPAFPIGYAQEVDPGAGDHITRHDPARVLAECAAKRAIIGDHELVAKIYLKDYCSTCADWENSELGEGPPGVEYPCPTVKALAAVYADHEDYDSGWAL